MRYDSMYFTLDSHDTPIPCHDVIHWMQWHEEHAGEPRLHMVTRIGNTEISTRFFGTELLGTRCFWETMVFVGKKPMHEYSSRVETLREAKERHRSIVDVVKENGEGQR